MTHKNSDVLVSHSGKQHAYKLAVSLQGLGRLSRFVTSSYYDPSRFPDKMLSRIGSVRSVLNKRNEPGLSDRVRRFPIFELPELCVRGIFGNGRLGSDAVCVRDALFDRFVAKTQMTDCRIFWGFQGSCLNSLESAKRKGLISVCEFATGHIISAIEILEEEKKNNPEWADSISNVSYPRWYLERLKAEPLAADHCIVASEFSRTTLEKAGVDPSRIKLLPLGADLEKFKFKSRSGHGNFRVLFIGGVGQRKGIKYLLDAIKKLNSDNIKFKIAGPIFGSGRALSAYSRYYEYLGKVSQERIVDLMHESDCLVLPSLFEGFGLVIPEAMATGMPVIATTHSAAPEIVRDGRDGFVLEPGDVDGLADRIAWMAGNRVKVVGMGKEASMRARDYSWTIYKTRLNDLLETAL